MDEKVLAFLNEHPELLAKVEGMVEKEENRVERERNRAMYERVRKAVSAEFSKALEPGFAGDVLLRFDDEPFSPRMWVKEAIEKSDGRTGYRTLFTSVKKGRSSNGGNGGNGGKVKIGDTVYTTAAEACEKLGVEIYTVPSTGQAHYTRSLQKAGHQYSWVK